MNPLLAGFAVGQAVVGAIGGVYGAVSRDQQLAAQLGRLRQQKKFMVEQYGRNVDTMKFGYANQKSQISEQSGTLGAMRGQAGAGGLMAGVTASQFGGEQSMVAEGNFNRAMDDMTAKYNQSMVEADQNIADTEAAKSANMTMGWMNAAAGAVNIASSAYKFFTEFEASKYATDAAAEQSAQTPQGTSNNQANKIFQTMKQTGETTVALPESFGVQETSGMDMAAEIRQNGGPSPDLGTQYSSGMDYAASIRENGGTVPSARQGDQTIVDVRQNAGSMDTSMSASRQAIVDARQYGEGPTGLSSAEQSAQTQQGTYNNRANEAYQNLSAAEKYNEIVRGNLENNPAKASMMAMTAAEIESQVISGDIKLSSDENGNIVLKDAVGNKFIPSKDIDIHYNAKMMAGAIGLPDDLAFAISDKIHSANVASGNKSPSWISLPGEVKKAAIDEYYAQIYSLYAETSAQTQTVKRK